MSDWPWVSASYALTWVVLGVYALRIQRRLVRARTGLEGEADRTGSSMEVES